MEGAECESARRKPRARDGGCHQHDLAERSLAKLLTGETDQLVTQAARCTAGELETMPKQQKCQVVYGAEVEGCILVAAFAWQGVLQRVSNCPSGTAHHFKWQTGGQRLAVRSGYLQGATRQEKDHVETSGLRPRRNPASPP